MGHSDNNTELRIKCKRFERGHFYKFTVSFSCGLHVNILFRSVLNKQKHAFCMILLHIHIYILNLIEHLASIVFKLTSLILTFFPSKCKWFGSITAVIISVAHLQCCREELELAGIVLVSGKMYHPTRRLCVMERTGRPAVFTFILDLGF